jgi:hypothetical protein
MTMKAKNCPILKENLLKQTKITHFYNFHPPGACGSGKTQALDVGMMRQVYYHCSIATGHDINSYKIFQKIISLKQKLFGFNPSQCLLHWQDLNP